MGVKFPSLANLTVMGLAIGLALFQLWASLSGTLPGTVMRPVHLVWVITLVLMTYPSFSRAGTRHGASAVVDTLLIMAVLASGLVLFQFDAKGITHLMDGLTSVQLIAGSVLLVMTLECTRRTVGWELALIGSLFVLYTLFGYLLPDWFAHRGYAWERVIRLQIFSSEGIFGMPLGIAATTVFIYVLFGAFLEISGAGKFFIDMARSLTVGMRGGPAKAAVLASAAMGSISGSAIANTVTSGSITIPMMKKLGYKPHQAAGIEAAASTGGQIMPPIMGAGAFIMAEYTSVPYSQIVMISIVPALLFFTCTLLFVHLMACRLGLEKEKRGEAWRVIFIGGSHFLIPLLIVTSLLVLNYSPPLAGAIGCALVVFVSWFRAHTRMTLFSILHSLKHGTLMMLPISLACATAGLVVGVIGQTGIGLTFAESVIDLAGENLWLALVLVGLAAIILGMGLPVTAAYIILASVAAPALQGLGLSLLVAHMVIFWLSQTSNVTPPVALTAFAAAGVAGAKPQASAVQAFKLAIGLLLIPVMMIVGPLLALPDVSFLSLLYGILTTLCIIVALAMALEGYGFTPLSWLERGLLIVLALAAIDGDLRLYALLMLVGLVSLHSLRYSGRRSTLSKE